MKATLFCGRYRVMRRLGSGGTATVFLAEDDKLGRPVAVKRLHGAEVTDETAERLRREARIMASLRHPNLVDVYDMLTDEDDLFLVMEYVEGMTLSHLLEDEGPLSPERTLELLRPVAAALDHAHASRVVHRDVKPSNILVGRGGDVKLADLGLATAAEITNITPPGSIIGTPAYMAPEQAQPLPCSPATDVYSLATIAFQALSGTLPRTGSSVLAVLRQATSMPPADLRDRRPGTPEAAAAVLIKAMAARPEDRHPSASAMLEELAEGLREDPPASEVAPTEVAPPVPRRTPPRAARRERTPADVLAVSEDFAPGGRDGPPSENRPTFLPVRRRPNRSGRLLAALALAAAIAVAAAVVLVNRGDPSSERRAATPTGTATATPEPAPADGATATPEATAGEEAPADSTPETADAPAGEPTPAPTPRALSATATVRAFYGRAAAGRYGSAWKLAGPNMRAVFGNSRAEFRRQLSSLQQIEFTQLEVSERADGSATLLVQSVATHSNRVDRGTGTLRTVRSSGRWLLEPAGLSCQSV